MKKNKGKSKKNESLSDNQSPIDFTLLDNSVRAAKKNPRFSGFSTQGKAMLDYLDNTTPKFSLSKKASVLLERGMKKEYPKLWDEVQKRLDRNTN